MTNISTDERIIEKIQDILQLYSKYQQSNISIAEMEKGLLTSLLSLGYVLLNLIIESKSSELENVKPSPKYEGEVFKNKGVQHRVYLSIFGELSIYRTGHYSRQRGNYYELDNELQLPTGKKLSYNLQELLGLSSTEQTYRNSVCILNRILGLNISSSQSKRNAEDLGELADTFYDKLEVPSLEQEQEVIHFIAYFDGKGVPKVREKKKEPREIKRLNTGEKRGTKQMATVSVNAHFTSKKREKTRIIAGLMEYPKKKDTPKNQAEQTKTINDNRWLQGIHRRAFLADQARAVEYGLDYIRDRMTNPQSRFIVPIDAGSGLEEKVMAYVKKHELTSQFDGIILDIIHVMEYLWDAANTIFNQKDKERITWVKQTLSQLLDSQTPQVIDKLEKIKKEKNLSKTSKIDSAITYFSNHQHKMDYKKFIDKGYPISSALAESTCGYLVKERMEGSGKRWTDKGAQNMMDLRAVAINGDFDQFMKFAIEYQQNKQFKKVA